MRQLHDEALRVLLDKERIPESLSSRNTRTILCVLAVVALALLVTTGLCYYFRWDDRRRSRLNVLRRYSYQELSVATKGFSLQHALEGQGSCRFFKGRMPGGNEEGDLVEVAVKRVASNWAPGDSELQQFLAEVHSIGRIQHKNIVTLRGWCHDNGELLLVYDYVPGGSLDRLLFSSPDRGDQGGDHQMAVISWDIRMKTLAGVAAGVACLHYECDQRIVHRGIKASNVMLDAMSNARLGDFSPNHHVTPSRIDPKAAAEAGSSLGYLAPELLQSGKATMETDVYSYGVLLLEVACGRRCIESQAPEDQVVLLDWVWKLLARTTLFEAADPRLQGRFDREEMGKVLSLALLCCHPDPASRPSMRNVVLILRGAAPLPALSKLNWAVVFKDQVSALNALNAHSGHDQIIDNLDLREDPSASSSTKYTRMKPLDVGV